LIKKISPDKTRLSSMTYWQITMTIIIFLPIYLLIGFLKIQDFGFGANTGFLLQDIITLTKLGASYTITILCYNSFLKCDKAVVVQNLFLILNIVFGYAVDIFLLDNKPNIFSTIGSCLILISVLGLGVIKIKKEISDEYE